MRNMKPPSETKLTWKGRMFYMKECYFHDTNYMKFEEATMGGVDEPGGKGNHRTQSLESSAKALEPKRRARYLTMAEMSVTTDTSHSVAYVANLVGDLPRTFKPAMGSSDAFEWKESCDSEINSLCHNATWNLVPLSQGRKAIGNQ
uniref:Uncharacterized protein n=1 Tax=Peronospora matthiolae TaxID=2874970 RepID=A0AAV1T526_9STRA